MNTTYSKIGKTIINKKTSRGYTLLFAVIVSVLVLSIATFILSVSRKQAILSSSARDSIYAFYAADSGLECALENIAVLATSSPSATIQCGAGTFNVIPPQGDASVAGTSTFYMFTGTGQFNGSITDPNSQSGAASCASTTVSYAISYVPATSTTITIETRGYNIGWKNSTHDCSYTGPRKVERAIRYTQYE